MVPWPLYLVLLIYTQHQIVLGLVQIQQDIARLLDEEGIREEIKYFAAMRFDAEELQVAVEAGV